jgi:Na+-transporting NADH:ubiquinone oxidoreductase subunit C
MILVSVVFTLALSLINELTIDTIKAQADFKNQKTLLYVFDIDFDSKGSREEIDKLYNQIISQKPVNNEDFNVYVATEDNEIIGYAFPIEGKGLWGTIKGYIAFDQHYNEIIGVDFISHSETPGLGGRIDELWFKDQFRGIKMSESESQKLEVIIYSPAPGSNAEPITGATLTSDSVRKMFNASISYILEEVRGEF